MTIDTIIGTAKRPAPAEVSRALAITAAVAEAIRAAGEIPEGTLKGAGLISVTNHLCRWTGPTFPQAQEEDELERARRRAPMQETR